MTRENEKPGQRSRADRASISNDVHKLMVPDKKRKVDIRIAFRKRLLQVRMSGACYQVALCLSDVYADNRTGEAFPSHASIARQTDLSIRAVQDAITALKKRGFLSTKRRGFSTSLSYVLLVPYPADSRSDEEEKLTSLSGSFSCLHPADVRGDGHENLPTNLTDELDCMNQTETEVMPCGPPSAVGSGDPPFDPTDLTRTADVAGDGQPEEAIRCPPDLVQQLAIVKSISGRPGRDGHGINQELLQLLRDGELSPSIGRVTVAMWIRKEAENAA